MVRIETSRERLYHAAGGHDPAWGHLALVFVALGARGSVAGSRAAAGSVVASSRWRVEDRQKASLTETVRSFEDYLPNFFPLPHPSWRSRIWIKKNPWFEGQLLPVLRCRVAEVLGR